MNEKCRDPCQGTCSITSLCTVYNHVPVCTCPERYTGDPFSNCYPAPCGSNTQCNDGICTCLAEYQGDPYVGCRPECVLNTDCPQNRACVRNKCVNPCSGIISRNPCSPSPCGPNSVCRVINQQPVCSCVAGYLGAPPACRPECTVSSDCPLSEACSNQKCVNPCPGSCGFSTICNVVNHNPICSCLPGFTGDPFVRCINTTKSMRSLSMRAQFSM